MICYCQGTFPHRETDRNKRKCKSICQWKSGGKLCQVERKRENR